MSYGDHRAVAPCKPPAPYVGGKRQLARRLADRIEAVEHRIYAEPFVGLGGVFLQRRFAAPVEIVNDRSRDVVNLFRILQRHIEPFMQMLQFQITSRADFDRLLASEPETLTDLERAARFLYLQRTAFGGKVAGRTFGISLSSSARFDVVKLRETLLAISERIAGVTIENLDFAEFIRRFDRPDTLFYLDPPYHGTEHFYGKESFTRGMFKGLAEQLASISGSFILTINDVPDMRETFAGFAIERIPVTYMLPGGHSAQKTMELIVSKVQLPSTGRLL